MAEGPGDGDGDLPAAAAVHGDRHAEPDRARGHLPAARVAARPLPHAGVRWATRPRTPSSRSSTPTATRDPFRDIGPVAAAADVERLAQATRQVHVAPSLKAYLVDVARPRGAARTCRSASRPGHPGAAAGGQGPGRGRGPGLRTARRRQGPGGAGPRPPPDRHPEAQLQGISPGDALAEVLRAVPVPAAH
jgi:hypothetical protein